MRGFPGIGPHNVTKFDHFLVRAVSRQRQGNHDDFFRYLSAAATKGKLWFGIAGVMATVPGRPRRAALHGLLALGVASAVTNLVFKTVLPRTRPSPDHLPVFRFVNPQPTSSSMPSGHSASAVAFAVGAGIVSPAIGLALAPVAAGVAYSRVHTGAHWPSDVVFGSALGAGAALLTRKWWPARPPEPTPRRTPADVPAIADGDGLVIAVNAMGGSYTPETGELLKKLFPKAHIHEIAEGEDVEAAVRTVASRPEAVALGVWGGDGTVGTAAAAAVEHSLPLLVLPGGTLNHFARDLGSNSMDDAVEALTKGWGASVDLGWVVVQRGLPEMPETIELAMLNTASVGVYPNLVRRRERLQPALGKPLASLVASLRTFAVNSPTTLRVDGVRHKLWIMYMGRGRYYPADHAPIRRPVLDDGVLDLRMISADEPFARARLLWAVVTGTVASSKVTHLSEAGSITIEAADQPLALAVDGEAKANVRSAEFSIRTGGLRVYSPLPPVG
ncbi:phosphatase PAP2 family protein [Arthrobacter sp. TES]|uniref:Phosphatase PAP2 family protein n=1 Tax=Paenarthrobacter ureafaciens TaxID=37931 RepID=A0AAX3EHR9_PAEUR|nr:MULTISPECIES: bifunctional phosphatase PAP2/diacylglycerol kinase family protein [Paenarthrobacter]AMB42277.1 PA-phosphatase [Arthrobacter sp. ATCC 21022]ERI36806.1 PA-phosphatase [Arthrobacter sp. AK-YN10]NKR12011.1 PA-phosphatase [Arthrobacter sp. M5]NKR16289.1 PA-phosphatase [Arthrobacter sp. M6]OEH57525.1 PA-phosphatase [Arthrobacter sp. D4]OEH58800.1 PA-phosphatase [Arthrobacter sp. D2]QOI64963.1 phosphatase PAP2 family protein [Arthrobacter sp. TES]BCW86372.1 glycerophosphatase [Ar